MLTTVFSVIFSDQILAAILGGFPTTLISSIKISLVGFTFGYIQCFPSSYHTQLSIWVHAMVVFLLDHPSSCLRSCFSSFSFSSHCPTYSQSDAVQASVRSHHPTRHRLSVIVRQQQSWWTLMAHDLWCPWTRFQNAVHSSPA